MHVASELVDIIERTLPWFRSFHRDIKNVTTIRVFTGTVPSESI
jgi:hypothetical protein